MLVAAALSAGGHHRVPMPLIHRAGVGDAALLLTLIREFYEVDRHPYDEHRVDRALGSPRRHRGVAQGGCKVVNGNLIDFHTGQSPCLGESTPTWTAIDDTGRAYAALSHGGAATLTLADPTLTPLSGVASVPLGIGDGGHGIFPVDAPRSGLVIVLPPR